jgi:polysaccharide biosynthesis transport protein
VDNDQSIAHPDYSLPGLRLNRSDLDEAGPGLAEYLAVIKRRRWQLLLPMLVLAPIAFAVAVNVPPVYRSTATILIERQEIPSELIRTTVTSFADQRIQVIRRRVMTLENLGPLIEEYNLYPGLRESKSLNAAVAKMRDDVDLDLISANVVDPESGRAREATIAFSLAFEDGSALTAQKVTNEVVTLFMAENLRQREAAVSEASDFLREEAGKLAASIRELDARLALFKEEHRDNLPELATLNRELMQRAEEQLRDTTLAARSLQEQQLFLETQLAQIDPHLDDDAAATGQGTDTPAGRLRVLEGRLVSIAARYGSSHPDRIGLEREIAALRQVVGDGSGGAIGWRQRDAIARELAVAEQRYSREHPDVKRLRRNLAEADRRLASTGQNSAVAGATNPAYVSLHARLEGIKLELDALRESRVGLESRIAAYEQRLMKAPAIEQQYNDLTRGYDNAVAKFREVKDKQLEAELAEALESKRKAERFVLIEPPAVPDAPVRPNRKVLLVLGLVGVVGAGVGNVAVRELLDKGLHGGRAIRLMTGAPPLALIPRIDTPADRRRRRMRGLLLAIGGACALAAAIAAFDAFVRPLDILWFDMLRRLDAYLPGVGRMTPGSE